MKTKEIISLSKKNFHEENLEKIKKTLSGKYEISYGSYTPEELQKAINRQSPFYIDNHFITGYDSPRVFVSDCDEKVSIERMVKAVIIEDINEDFVENIEFTDDNIPSNIENSYPFVIMGKNEWDEPIPEFHTIFGTLMVGEVFLPLHSAIFNFLNQTDDQKKKKIVSCLSGANINVFNRDNYIDNCIHEIGHMVWRDCTKFEEKKKFEDHFEILKPSALYEYDWERVNPEEMFCTLYKWYVKSILIDPSFYNILEFEDKAGCNLIKSLFDRIAKERLIEKIWGEKKEKLIEYLNPKYDKTTGKRFVKEGLFKAIEDIKIPDSVLNNVDRFQDGIVYVKLEKAVIPVKGNEIAWEIMQRGK